MLEWPKGRSFASFSVTILAPVICLAMIPYCIHRTASFSGVVPMSALLYEPFYQLLRLRLLADRMVTDGGAGDPGSESGGGRARGQFGVPGTDYVSASGATVSAPLHSCGRDARYVETARYLIRIGLPFSPARSRGAGVWGSCRTVGSLLSGTLRITRPAARSHRVFLFVMRLLLAHRHRPSHRALARTPRCS